MKKRSRRGKVLFLSRVSGAHCEGAVPDDALQTPGEAEKLLSEAGRGKPAPDGLLLSSMSAPAITTSAIKDNSVAGPACC